MHIDEAVQRVSRFRVETRENETLLVSGTQERHEFPLRVSGILASLSGHVTYAGRSLSPTEVGHSRWLTFEHVNVSIGAAGSEGFRSLLADDSVFVVDGARLKHLPLESMRALELTEFERMEREYRLWRQETGDAEAAWTGDTRPAAISETDKDPPFGRGYLAHVPADRELGGERVEIVVGIPEPQYSELYDGCLARRLDRITVGCMFMAHSTAAFFETPREVVLFPEQSVLLRVDDVSVGCNLGRSSPQVVEQLEEGPGGGAGDSHGA